MFAYIAGTPFAYIDYYHLLPQHYGLLFGVNIVGLMGANALNARIVRSVGSDRMMLAGTALAAASGLALGFAGRFGWFGLAGLAIPLLFFVAALGFIVANSVAGALQVFPARAGALSAFVGAAQYGSGILGSALVGWFADGTAWTMAWVVAGGGIGSLAATFWLLSSSRSTLPVASSVLVDPNIAANETG